MRVKKVLISITACTAPIVFANPSLESIHAGKVEVHHSETHTQINQHSQQAILSWHSFNIAPAQSVHFQQPHNGCKRRFYIHGCWIGL